MNSQSQKLKLLFWFWPFGAFIMAVRNIRIKSYHPIILMFSFLYGYSVYMYSGDVVRYAESFEVISRATWQDFFYLLQQSYTGKDYGIGHFGIAATQPDIYALTLQFLVSRVTENSRWFFAIVSLIYTYLFLTFLKEIQPEIKWNNSFWQKIFFVYLLLVVPFCYPVIGVRFWSALYVFLLFSLKYIKSQKRIYILWSFTSVLFHFSFIIPVLLLFVLQFIKWSKHLATFLVLIATIFFTLTSSTQVAHYVSQSAIFFEDSTTLKNRVESYGDSDSIERRDKKISETNWYARWNRTALVNFLILTFLLEFFGVLKFKKNHFLEKLQPFYLLIFILCMFTINIGVISRFNYIFRILALARYAILCGINPNNQSLRIVTILLIPILIMHIAVTARIGFYTVDPLLIISPSIIVFLKQSSISLSELLVGH